MVRGWMHMHTSTLTRLLCSVDNAARIAFMYITGKQYQKSTNLLIKLTEDEFAFTSSL